MTRKDFEEVAEIISKMPWVINRFEIRDRFVEYFKKRYPKFNEDKFNQACAPEVLDD